MVQMEKILKEHSIVSKEIPKRVTTWKIKTVMRRYHCNASEKNIVVNI
jgi:hypothetical protein